MTERDFVEKLERVGFEAIEVLDRKSWSVNSCALYPLFDEDLIALMRRSIPPEQQDHVADSIVITARRSPGA